MSSGPSVDKGDIILVDVPYLDASRSVRRPTLVLCDTSQMLDIVIAAISSRIRDPLPAAHYIVDRIHPDWSVSGLRLESVVRFDRIFTVHGSQIHRKLGALSTSTMSEVNNVLKSVFRIT